jgi:uncharacterized CHY-type Zn-finger protein
MSQCYRQNLSTESKEQTEMTNVPNRNTPKIILTIYFLLLFSTIPTIYLGEDILFYIEYVILIILLTAFIITQIKVSKFRKFYSCPKCHSSDVKVSTTRKTSGNIPNPYSVNDVGSTEDYTTTIRCQSCGHVFTGWTDTRIIGYEDSTHLSAISYYESTEEKLDLGCGAPLVIFLLSEFVNAGFLHLIFIIFGR